MPTQAKAAVIDEITERFQNSVRPCSPSTAG